MSAAARELIATIRSAGGDFSVLDGRVRVEAPAPLPAELMGRLRAVKGELFALLASGELGLSVLSGAAMFDAAEERAALAADRVPACYLEAWAMLNHQMPARVSVAAWLLALDDAGGFLDQWGGRAAKLGWRPGELFAARAGLIWRLHGGLVEAIDADRALLASGLVIIRQETRGSRS